MSHSYFCDWCRTEIENPAVTGRTIRHFAGVGPRAEDNSESIDSSQWFDAQGPVSATERLELCGLCWHRAKAELGHAKSLMEAGS